MAGGHVCLYLSARRQVPFVLSKGELMMRYYGCYSNIRSRKGKSSIRPNAYFPFPNRTNPEGSIGKTG